MALKIELYKDKSIDDLTKAIANPEEKVDTGSAAASAGALSAALLCRASALAARNAENPDDKIDCLVRNTEVLRSYFVKLVDEDVRCRGPLRRAEKEGDARKIEAARQTAVAICAEVVHMSGTCLDVTEQLLPYATEEIAPYLRESTQLSMAAAEMCVPYILRMGSFSTDETYRYVLKRENELNLGEMETVAARIREALAE